MIDPSFVRTMATYNSWQNDAIYAAADALSDDDRRADRGAFFGSIHGTLAHLLWGDQIWLHRFAATPKPRASSIDTSASAYDRWDALCADRRLVDRQIETWAQAVTEAWLAGDLAWYSGAAGRDLSRPRQLLVAHFFNHQTHHRGQVHAMLTAAGAKTQPTDLMLLPAFG